MNHRHSLLVCLALSASLQAGCEVVVDFDEDALDAGRTVDLVPLRDGSVPSSDGSVRSDAALVQPEDAGIAPPDAATGATDAGDLDAALMHDASDGAPPGAASAPDAASSDGGT